MTIPRRLQNLIDLARAVQAVPHLIKVSGELELRVAALEKQIGDVEALAREINVFGKPSTHAGGAS